MKDETTATCRQRRGNFHLSLKSWILIPLSENVPLLSHLTLTLTQVLTKEYPWPFSFHLQIVEIALEQKKFCLLRTATFLVRERKLSGKLFRIIKHANPGYFYAKEIDFQFIQPCNEIHSWLTRQTRWGLDDQSEKG